MIKNIIIRLKYCIVEYFSNVLLAFKMLVNENANILILSIAVGIIQSFMSLLFVIFPSLLIRLLEYKQFEYAYIFVILVIAIRFGLERLSAYLVVNIECISDKMSISLKEKLCNSVFNISYEEFEESSTFNDFDMAKKCVDNKCLEKYIQCILKLFSSVFTLIGLFYIISSLKWWMLITMIVITLAHSIANVLHSQQEVSQFSEETIVQRQLEYTRYWLTERSRSKEVRSYSLRSFVVDKLKQYNEEYFDIMQKYTKKHKNIFWWVYILNAIQMILLYTYCTLLYFEQSISIDVFILHLSALLSFSGILVAGLSPIIEMYKNGKYARHLYRFIIKSCNSADTCDNIKLNELHSIEFQNVFYKYPNQKSFALNDVSFSLFRGEKYSIVGPNGSGKTTIVKLLLGLYKPTSGKILINGIDRENISIKAYQQLMSVIFQDFTIYNFSVQENVALSSDVNLLRINDIFFKLGLTTVNLDSYISKLYSDEGIDVSGGEGQKIVIARALYFNRPFLILDEPTSALSPQSEYDIYQKFYELTAEKTVIFVSHRMASCKLSDKVIVINEGTVQEIGSHMDLINKDGLYKRMFNAQAGLYID